MRTLSYPPHITLAKFDDIAADELEAIINSLADTPALTLTFDLLGSFDPGFLILWAAPKVQQTLFDLHARLNTMIDPARCAPSYRPANWQPHCSIALRVADHHRDAANRFLEGGLEPFELTFDLIDAVASPPIKIIAERVLNNRRTSREHSS